MSDQGQLATWDLESAALDWQVHGPHPALQSAVFLDDETLAVGFRDGDGGEPVQLWKRP